MRWSNYVTFTVSRLATARVVGAERQRHLRISASAILQHMYIFTISGSHINVPIRPNT